MNALIRPGRTQEVFRRFGDRFSYRFPGFPEIVVTKNGGDLREVFLDRDKSWSWGAFLRRFSPHDVLFGDSYIFFDHAGHQRERRAISAPFNGKAVKSYQQKMVDVVDRNIDRWPVETPVSFFALSHRLASDVMAAVVFGVTDPHRMTALDRALSRYFSVVNGAQFEGLAALGLLTGGKIIRHPRLSSVEGAIDRIILQEIAERRQRGSIDESDVLGRYLAEPNGAYSARDDEALAASARKLMFAGYETTAATLAWAGAFLSRNPEILAELEETIDRDDDEFLEAVVNEVMRLRPAVPLTGRRAVRDTKLGETRIPAGTALLIPILGIHESADHQADPLVFRPHRFYFGHQQPTATTLLPFGGGVHKCLGGQFAHFELKVLLRTFLRTRTFAAQNTPIPPPRLRTELMVPRDGAQVVLRKR
ncbi:cytochrome P450 [Nocardia sp. MDA0666]|uniref:cytochrome P450 n=1 Tax=Nocardia sp. MDA0666 TaxID=2135448 RepID=UPI001E2E82B3|nr:cytochrome P450 [Nocardia sp. MDA0666]